MKFKILGTGSYVPENVVDNEMLSAMVETSDEWIRKRVGIKERHISVDETTSDIATKAALNAIENSKVKAEDLDLILCATITPERLAPNVASLVQRNIGATCPCIDVGGTACSGFIYALETATAFLSTGKYKNILVIGADRLSSIVDWEDRNTCIIFADGSGAAVVNADEDNYLASTLFADGGDDVLNIPNVTGHSPFYKGKQVDRVSIFMKGQDTYRFALGAMQRDVLKVMDEANLTNEDIKWVIPHQANIRIINEAARKLPIDKEKFCSNIAVRGNTSAASVAILLDEMNRAGKIERGDVLILCAFGAGLLSGACAIRF